MEQQATHWERERIQFDHEIRIIERERALEHVILLLRRHHISVDELAGALKRTQKPQQGPHGPD
jgi:hypothetical protein